MTLLAPIVITALVMFSLSVRGTQADSGMVAVLYLVCLVSIAAILDFRNVCDRLVGHDASAWPEPP